MVWAVFCFNGRADFHAGCQLGVACCFLQPGCGCFLPMVYSVFLLPPLKVKVFLLILLKWPSLPQFLSVLCMSHSLLPAISSCAPQSPWLLIFLLFNPFSSPALPCPFAVLCSAPDTFPSSIFSASCLSRQVMAVIFTCPSQPSARMSPRSDPRGGS